MRFLLSTYGSRGDVEPFVALSARLTELGSEVRVCAPPDEEFEERLAAVGATALPLGRSAREVVAEGKPSSVDIRARAAEFVATHTAQLRQVLEARGCDLVLATGLITNAAGARSVADKLGIPAAYATFQQVTLPSPHRGPLAYPGKPLPENADNQQLWEHDAASQDEIFGEPLNAERAELGLPPVGDIRSYYIGERPLLATDPVLDPWVEPNPQEVVQTGQWVLEDRRPLPADLEAFLNSGEPPVYVGFGSMGMHDSPELSRVVVESVRAQGRRAVLGRGWVGMRAIDDADDVLAVGEVNHSALFPRVAAVVHHGGAGTTHAAARAAAPQVIVPQLADQPYWSRRVADLGIGAAHDGAAPTAESLSAALREALAPETALRARSIADRMRTDGAKLAAEHLVERAAGGSAR
ncbi:glycosyltransferase [Saccharopolyspora griseoalba]|uniref:Glycosyltransferase n=1 Tax=Saccharopolyspora griseoalba TaxID=1431848 RepID=A0ABW2LMH3_9PSEU